MTAPFQAQLDTWHTIVSDDGEATALWIAPHRGGSDEYLYITHDDPRREPWNYSTNAVLIHRREIEDLIGKLTSLLYKRELT